MKIEKIIVNKVPALGSSADSDKLALTVKGVLIGIIPIVILVSGAFGVSLNPTDLQTLVDSIVNAVVAISLAVSTIVTAIGLVRKLINR